MKEEKIQLSTIDQQLILASSSPTRIKMIRYHFKNAQIVGHKIDEKMIKQQNKKLDAQNLVALLAKVKAESLADEFADHVIIGSDQILHCNKKKFDKPKDLKEARNNLLDLRGKCHYLESSIFVIKKGKPYFSETKTAQLIFKKISTDKIDEYLNKNKKHVMESVGSYRIEDNKKYKFLEIVSGDEETIKGFPLTNFLNKLRK